jgi:hypothetical protein
MVGTSIGCQRLAFTSGRYLCNACSGLCGSDVTELLKKRNKSPERIEIVIADPIGVNVHYVVSDQPHVVQFFNKCRSIDAELETIPQR